jgi:hypothetical protein
VYDAERRHGYERFVEVCCSVQAFWGTGGGNVPIVVMYDGRTNYADREEIL